MPSFAEYERHDATGLSELLRTSQISARELVEAAIDRIEAKNPAINAIVHRSFERARSEAERLDRDRDYLADAPFRGVPFVLKDLKAGDAGQPSCGGSRLLRGHRAARDSEIVRRFKRAGLVIVGRSNTPEFGILGVTEPELFGPTRNPWNPAHTPGGSSGGSAAAVAAGMVPVAHASDGGGSIRIPASCCGLVGLKPTRGRVPLPPWSGYWGGFAIEHVVARSVRDSAGLLDCIHGRSPGDHHSAAPPEHPFATALDRAPGRLRIALCTSALFAEHTDPECVRAAEQAAELCRELGHEVVEAKPEFDRGALVRAYLCIVAVGTASAIREAEALIARPARPGDVEDKTWLLRCIGESLSAPDYIAELDTVRREATRAEAFFDDHDLLLTPTLAQPPIEVGALDPTLSERALLRVLRAAPLKAVLLRVLDELARDPLAPNPNTQLFNMTGQPAISVPMAQSRSGLPIGLQFAGPIGGEHRLLRLAAQLEQARPWAERRPA